MRAEEPLPFLVEPMQLEDIPAVMEVERLSFRMPWPGNAYRRELKENRMARYVVARRTGSPLARDSLEGQDVRHHPTPQARQRGLMGFLNHLVDVLGGPGEPLPEPDERGKRVVGYAGLWLMVDEAHITAVAVAPPYRGLGIGELMMLRLIDIARDMGGQYLTLEVRVSNSVAQNLYKKYGFKETGVRRKYYSDDNEDALIMWSDPLDSPGFRSMVENHRHVLLERLRSPRTVAELRSRASEA